MSIKKRDAPSRRVSKKLDERVMTESTRLDRTPGCQLTLLVTSKIPCKVPHTHKIAGYLPIFLSIYLSIYVYLYLSIYPSNHPFIDLLYQSIFSLSIHLSICTITYLSSSAKEYLNVRDGWEGLLAVGVLGREGEQRRHAQGHAGWNRLRLNREVRSRFSCNVEVIGSVAFPINQHVFWLVGVLVIVKILTF